jgi:FkbM family methyltransferase
VTPDKDPSPPPFGALAPNALQAAVIALAHHSGLKRGALRLWLSRLVELLRAGPLDVSYQGASFRLCHRTSATERGALFNPDCNREELDFLRAHTPGGGVFVDVGAHIGTYALALARHVGPRGEVIAIEPHPMIHERLAFNRSASGFAQVRLVAAAAGDADGEQMIAAGGDIFAASHVVTSGAPAANAFKVPALRLQRILDEAGAIKLDGLKIDVRGFEDRVLLSFFHEAPEGLWPRAVVINHLSRGEWREDFLADMVARGYRDVGRTHSNTLLLRD